jgi:hypothetical protein
MSIRDMDQLFPKIELSGNDNHDFQSRRYGASFLMISQMPSGRIVIASPTRDPILILEPDTLPYPLLELLAKGTAYSSRNIHRLTLENEALMKRAKEPTDAELGDLEIDL